MTEETRTRTGRLQTGLIAAAACLFSLCITVGRHIVFSGDVFAKQAENHMTPLSAADLPVFAAVAAAALCVLLAMHRHFDRISGLCLTGKERRHGLLFACFAALCLLAAWLPYTLSIAPGIVHADSMESIGQMLEHGHPTSNHHPMFYTLLVGVFMKMGTVLFGSVSAGVMLYSAFQVSVTIFCIVCILTLMYHQRVSGVLIGAALAYYMFLPVFPNMSVTMWKDPLFSCMLLALSVLLYVLIDREKIGRLWFVLFGAAGLGAMMFRNNGVYVFFGAAVLAAWLVRRHAKRLAVTALAALALYAGMSAAATRVWNIYSDYVENLGIPLQQLGYAINNGGEFSQEDTEYLFELMPQEVWNYAYRPCLVDTIKWNPQFNLEFLLETKGQFFRVWLNGLIRNPAAYVKAYLLETFGFWLPGVQNEYGYTEILMTENDRGIAFVDLFAQLFGRSIRPAVEAYQVYIGSGTLLWLFLLGGLLAGLGGRERCAPYLPALLNWGTVMIATPVAFSLRYVYIFALALPLYLAIPVMSGRSSSSHACAAESRRAR